MTVEPNPFNWSANVKTLAGVLTLVMTIVGSAWTAAEAIGDKIYAFAQGQTLIIENLRGLKNDLTPRVQILEKDMSDVKSTAAAAKQRVDDMDEYLKEIKTLAQDNYKLSKSHDEDIRATRQAVAPTDGAPGEGAH